MPRQNTAPSDFPQAVLQQIAQLGQNIAIARKRRGESQAQWAKKLGVSQPTMARIERGDPAVSMAFYVMSMWLINQTEGLAALIAPQHDHAALEKEVTKARAKRQPANAAATAQKQPKAAAPEATQPDQYQGNTVPKTTKVTEPAPQAYSALRDAVAQAGLSNAREAVQAPAPGPGSGSAFTQAAVQAGRPNTILAAAQIAARATQHGSKKAPK